MKHARRGPARAAAARAAGFGPLRMRSPLRLRIVLAVLFAFVLLINGAFFLVQSLVNATGEFNDRLQMVSALELTRLWIDLEYAGAWTATGSQLYKGGRPLRSDQELTAVVAPYFQSRRVMIESRVGSVAPLLAEPWNEGAFTQRMARNAERRMSAALAGEDFPLLWRGGAVLPLRNAAGTAVGWLEAIDDGPFDPTSGQLPSIVFVGGLAVTVLLTLLLGVFLLKLSAPIDSIEEDRSIAALANRELTDKLRHDPLTGLLNRRGLLDAVAYLDPADAASAWVAFVDIDRFKVINDNYGHATGDEALRFLARILANHVRKGDLCARWGGEEFLLVLRSVDRETILGSGERLRGAVQAVSFSMGEIRIGLTVTIGLAPIGARGMDSAVAAADRAMYEGKRTGRNRCVLALAE